MQIIRLSVDDLIPFYTTGKHVTNEGGIAYNAPVILVDPNGRECLTTCDGAGVCTGLMHAPSKQKYKIVPRNVEQQYLQNYLRDPNIKILFALGPAGTGKTFCTLAHALNDKRKVLYTRSFVPVGQAMGYMPGGVDEKMAPWLMALKDTVENLGLQEIPAEDIECTPITFMRGRSLQNRLVIIDEAQNLSYHELKTVLTRLGDGCKVVVMGDPSQCDMTGKERPGLLEVYDRMMDSSIVASITLTQVERGEIAALAADRL